MLVLIACAMNTMIIFFQPPNVCSDHVLHRALNAIIIGTFAFDITLKIGYEGMTVNTMLHLSSDRINWCYFSYVGVHEQRLADCLCRGYCGNDNRDSALRMPVLHEPFPPRPGCSACSSRSTILRCMLRYSIVAVRIHPSLQPVCLPVSHVASSFSFALPGAEEDAADDGS